MAPNVPQLWIPRATMLLHYWRYLTIDELLAMRAQLHTIWTNSKAMRLPLLMAAARVGEAPMISWGLGDDPPAHGRNPHGWRGYPLDASHRNRDDRS